MKHANLISRSKERSSRRLLQQAFGLTLVVLLLAGCGGAPAEPTATPLPPTPTLVPEHAAVQRVKAFHEAINAVELDNYTQSFKEHTIHHGLPSSILIIAMSNGLVRYSSMKYELVSESAKCAVVGATGDITIGSETGTLDEKYVVVKQEDEWLINLIAESCN
jgi:hypothetical protein